MYRSVRICFFEKAYGLLLSSACRSLKSKAILNSGPQWSNTLTWPPLEMPQNRITIAASSLRTFILVYADWQICWLDNLLIKNEGWLSIFRRSNSIWRILNLSTDVFFYNPTKMLLMSLKKSSGVFLSLASQLCRSVNIKRWSIFWSPSSLWHQDVILIQI